MPSRVIVHKLLDGQGGNRDAGFEGYIEHEERFAVEIDRAGSLHNDGVHSRIRRPLQGEVGVEGA